MKTALISIALVVFSCMIQHGVEAAITGWTNPGSTDGAATPAIPENTGVGTTGVTIEATADGAITYTIETQPTAGKLTIASGGLLSLAAGNSFDFETEPTYVLTVIATDGGDDATGTATVTLSIEDVNEAPAFGSAQYVATVPDASTEGTAVITVTATDQDASDTFTYSISGSDFAIASTGAITVATDVTLDAGMAAGYSLTVTATDADGEAGTTTLWIAVTDCTGSSAGVVVASLLSLFVAFSVVLY